MTWVENFCLFQKHSVLNFNKFLLMHLNLKAFSLLSRYIVFERMILTDLSTQSTLYFIDFTKKKLRFSLRTYSQASTAREREENNVLLRCIAIFFFCCCLIGLIVRSIRVRYLRIKIYRHLLYFCCILRFLTSF